VDVAKAVEDAYPGGFTQNYADQVFTSLGATADQIKEAKAKAAGLVTQMPVQEEPGLIKSKRPADVEVLKRMASAYRSNEDLSELAKRIRPRSFGAKFHHSRKLRLGHYTGSSYGSMNKALRDPRQGCPICH